MEIVPPLLYETEYLISELQLRLHEQTTILTCQILVFTNVCVSPRIIAAVCNALVFPHPDQSVRTVVQLRLPELALPVAVAVLHVPHHLGLCEAGVILQNLVRLLRPRYTGAQAG